MELGNHSDFATGSLPSGTNNRIRTANLRGAIGDARLLARESRAAVPQAVSETGPMPVIRQRRELVIRLQSVTFKPLSLRLQPSLPWGCD